MNANNAQSIVSPATLVFDEVLDATAAKAMRRFEQRTRRTSQSEAAIDLRRTRSVASAAWATLVKGVRDLSQSGHNVTVIAGKRMQGLLQLSGIVRFAHVIIV
jgi:ABC-type transporter Mla MlaB component